MYKQIILNKIYEYLKHKKWTVKKSGKIIMFQCPFCKKEPITAQQIPNTSKINCFNCKKKYNLIDIVKAIEPDKKDSKDEDIFQYLKETLKIQVTTKKEEDDIGKILDFYEKNKWALVAISPNSKIPVEQMKGWSTKEYRNKIEWESWVINGLNLATRTGEASNITVLDIDVLLNDEKEEFRYKKIGEERKKVLLNKRKEGLDIIYNKIKDIMGDPLIQKNLGGEQLIYQYESDLPKTIINIDNIHIDVENDGGYILIEPSKLGITTRKFKEFKDIPKMPVELKKLLLSKITTLRKTNNETIQDDIETESFKLHLFDEGTRNNSLVRLGGVFRKQFSPNDTKRILHILNNHNYRSGSYKEIESMARELEKYTSYDEQDLAHQIIEYLRITESASKAEIEIAVLGKRAVGEDKKRVDKTLVYLIKEEKIIKKGQRHYKLVQIMEWKETLIDIGVPVNFKVPYLNDYAYFNKGDFIVIGSQSKYGKTTLSINMIKRLVDQGIKPYYIYSESGGRFAKVALKLGLKDGDFYHIFCGNPEEIKLEPNAITIYDWVRPTDGFNKTDELYDKIVQKLQKTKGFMICFVQLKKENKWFAENMITQYPALACKYLYEDENDGIHTKFEIAEVRDSKVQGKKFEIPCVYDWSSKIVSRIDELKKEE